MSFRYFIEKHIGKNMMMQTLRYGILKLNHLLPNEVFKQKKTRTSWGQQKIKCCFEMLGFKVKREGVIVNSCQGLKKEGKMINHINLVAMIKVLRVQLPKQVVGMMVVIDKNPMSTHVIGKEACLQVKSPYGLFKDRKPKRCPNI